MSYYAHNPGPTNGGPHRDARRFEDILGGGGGGYQPNLNPSIPRWQPSGVPRIRIFVTVEFKHSNFK